MRHTTVTRRVLITGSRDWDDQGIINAALQFELWVAEFLEEDMVVIHGAATGADSMAGRWAEESPGVTTEVYPADWEKHGKAAGHIRNQQMVDTGADVCLAFPLPSSRGTPHCMKIAEEAGIQVLNYGYFSKGP